MDADEVIKVECHLLANVEGSIAICKTVYSPKVDLPEIKPYVVEYQLEHGRCRKCGKEEAANYRRCYIRYIWTKVKSIIAAFSGFYKIQTRNSEYRK
ncbi:transposase, degenerate [Trichonephila inaurata madagascariensis]|uniref:Transposase, degenerate n=1 Tax=Trichonephila inaurata madagascariensis TaxID=2747483 RepID=A0A8X7CV41_9ARAC|nr:transposase, degenerate [Trichonephila inaurata madagascariensis]